MKILLVFPGFELGGAERQGLHLARYFKSIGFDVCTWSTLAGEGRLIEECVEAGIPYSVHRFLWPCRKSSLARDGWRLIRALRSERPDVILSYTTSPNVGCAIFWRFSAAKACIWGQRNTNDLRGDALERFAYRRASGVICNAAHQVEYLDGLVGKTRAPVHVVHNGLSLPKAEKTRQKWRNDLDIPAKALVAVMLANFRPQKDHTTLLRAWKKTLSFIPSGACLPYLILAGAPQFTYDEVKHLASELGIHKTVRLPGHVKDVGGLLSASDIGILISHHEGLSNAVLEYMAAGLPVIATDLPGNREALGGHFEHAFCRMGDPDSLSELLLKMLNSPGLRQKTGKMNRKRAVDNFSVQAMCERTAHIISGLLKDKV